MRSSKDAQELLSSLGLDCKIGDEVFDLICKTNPTVRAFMEGEISFKEALFVESYLTNGFHVGRAVEAANFAGLRAGASQQVGRSIMQSDDVKRLIARRIAEKALSSDEVLAEWAEVAKIDMADFVTLTEMNHPLHDVPISVAVPDMAKAAERGKLHLVKRVKMDINGNFTLELRDSDQALNQIARHLGMFEKDNVLNIPKGLIDLLNSPAEERKKKLDEYREMLEEDE